MQRSVAGLGHSKVGDFRWVRYAAAAGDRTVYALGICALLCPGRARSGYQDLESPATSRLSWRGEEVVRLIAERKPM